jgi:hypothetical protein
MITGNELPRVTHGWRNELCRDLRLSAWPWDWRHHLVPANFLLRLKMPDGRRLARILLNTATVLSLLLCLGSAALWMRSYGTADQLRVGEILIHSEYGAFYLTPEPRDLGYPIRDSFNAGELGVIERESSDEGRRVRPT